MRLSHALAVLALGASFTVAADASPVTFTFQDVTFRSGSTGSGTIVIDPVTGIAGAIDFAITGPTDYLFDVAAPHDQFEKLGGGGYEITYFDPAGDVLQMGVVQSTLVGYDGGDLCIVDASGNQVNCFGGSDVTPAAAWLNPALGGSDPVLSGDLVPLASTPEPSSLLLLGTGLLCVVGLFRRRPVRAVAVTASEL